MKFFAENVCGHKFAPKRNINQGHYNVTSPFGCNCAKYLHTCAIPALIHTLIHTPIPAARSNDNHPMCNCHPELVSGSYKCTLKNNNRQLKKPAFTLAELLTAILIISVIMVALAPVITKRMKDSIAVTTDNKKGLEIFTNPGTYTFDVPIGINTLFLQGAGGGGGGAGANESISKSVSYTSNTTWTVPKGVNKITLEITGAGGGGGAGNGKATGKSCRSDEFRATRGADTESDLCYTKTNAIDAYTNDGFGEVPVCKRLNPYETCTGNACIWNFSANGKQTYICSDTPGGVKACGWSVATPECISRACRYLHSGYPKAGIYRLPKFAELEKVNKYIDTWSRNAGTSGLGLCTRNYLGDYADQSKVWYEDTNKVPYCQNIDNICPGVFLDTGQPWAIPASDYGFFAWNGGGEANHMDGTGTSSFALFGRCVTPLLHYNNYSASGGASGAIMEKEINVLPNDKLEITIGSGGDGGKYGTNANNGISSRSGNGKQGGQTKVVHKRGSTTLGTYYVKGGFGGYGATTSAHGEAITNGTSSSQTTPNGTCYANGNIGCSYSSYSGESGTSTKGGNGGRVKNEGSITNGLASSGGYLYIDSTRTANQRATDEEIRLAKGQNATEPGFGGGGGLTPAWATGTSHFYQGGRGANGKVDITYKVSLPGGGGGSGARVGGYTSDNKMYEIKYKVKEGDRIVFKVGSGGSGGVSSQDGLNGSATVVGDNEIVFMAGEGGKTSTNDDKNNLRGGRGGYSSYINEEDIVQSNVTSGIKIKNTTNTTYTFKPSNNSFKGQNGKRGGVPSTSDIQSGYSLNNTIFNYGFSGGMGASPFGISQSKIGASITCGGGNIVSVSNIAMTLGQMTNINYLCTSGNIKGNDARSHDPVNNEFGGSGGGGGGVVDDSFELGSGGSGSSGYLRIRWDASEQD